MALETRITGACVMIFPDGIMDGIGDESGYSVGCSFLMPL